MGFLTTARLQLLSFSDNGAPRVHVYKGYMPFLTVLSMKEFLDALKLVFLIFINCVARWDWSWIHSICVGWLVLVQDACQNGFANDDSKRMTIASEKSLCLMSICVVWFHVLLTYLCSIMSRVNDDANYHFVDCWHSYIHIELSLCSWQPKNLGLFSCNINTSLFCHTHGEESWRNFSSNCIHFPHRGQGWATLGILDIQDR